MERIVNIKVEQIYPHPDNPRKDVGDVAELAESIKKNGIMQNLTVIPISALTEEPDKQPGADEISLLSDFHALIGHRRLAAAKMAGLSEVPCKIVSKISKKEQVGIMLEENMQRNDLTIYEQAQGFQMMLDLGETEDSIAEKTGFSKTTIRHRLNIAKLDQAELKKKEQDDSFQLSLKDLYALEQVGDIKTRNKILKEARDSRDLIWKAQNAVNSEKRQKKIAQFKELFKEADIKAAPKGTEHEMWNGKWDVVKEWDIDGKEVPTQLRISKGDEELFWIVLYERTVKVIKKHVKPKKEVTPEELAKKKRDAEKKRIEEILKNMNARRKDFIMNIINGKIEPLKNEGEIKDEIWRIMMSRENIYVSSGGVFTFFTGKSCYMCSAEETDAGMKQVAKCSVLHQMLAALSNGLSSNNLYLWDYNDNYNESMGNTLIRTYNLLERYGWSFEEEEEQLINGTHGFYKNKK